MERDRTFLFFSNNKIGGDKISFHYRYRKQIIISIVVFLMIFGTGIIIFLNQKPKSKEEPLILKKKEKKEVKEEIAVEYKVDIKGEIQNPGIYTLTSSSRIIDVIEAAGGLTEKADTSVINLSKKIIDEMVIIIYSKQEVKEFENTKRQQEQVIEQCIQKDQNSIKNDACISIETSKDNSKDTGMVSLNNASIEELMTLTGVGEAKAKEIIRYREEKKGFKKIEELLEVSGIGESIFAKIKDRLTL